MGRGDLEKGGWIRILCTYLQYMPLVAGKAGISKWVFSLGWQLGLSRLVRRSVDLAAMFLNWGEEVVLWAGGMRRGLVGFGGIWIGGEGWMSGEGGGGMCGYGGFGERRCGGRVVGSVVFIRNLEGLVGVAGARFGGGGFMWFMPATSVCRDCSEGIGEGGRLASLREREGFAWIRTVLLDVAGEREGLCAKQGTAALVSLIDGTRKRGVMDGVCALAGKTSRACIACG